MPKISPYFANVVVYHDSPPRPVAEDLAAVRNLTLPNCARIVNTDQGGVHVRLAFPRGTSKKAAFSQYMTMYQAIRQHGLSMDIHQGNLF